MAYVKNPDLTKAGIAVLAAVNASLAVEYGLGVFAKAASVMLSWLPSFYMLQYWCHRCTPMVCKQSFFVSDCVHGLQRCLSQPLYTVCAHDRELSTRTRTRLLQQRMNFKNPELIDRVTMDLIQYITYRTCVGEMKRLC